MKDRVTVGMILAVSAACVTAFSAPGNKILVQYISPTMNAGLLNIGCFIGMVILMIAGRNAGLLHSGRGVKKSDVPALIGLIATEVAAPICMMYGLSMASAASAALLSNFEAVATAVVAMMFLKERISPKMWLALGLVTAGSIILSVDDLSNLNISLGAILVLLACIFWGISNNILKLLSVCDFAGIIALKGLGSGSITVIIAFLLGESLPDAGLCIVSMVFGFLIYGLMFILYMFANRYMPVSKVTTVYSINTFLAAIVSCVIFWEAPTIALLIAFLLMVPGVYLTSKAEREENR